MSPPSSRYTGASRANLTLGGGAPTYTTAVGEVLGAEAPLDVIPTTVEGRSSHLPIASFLWSISTAVSLQNEPPCLFDHVGSNLIVFRAP
jgi:hypothetical protein